MRFSAAIQPKQPPQTPAAAELIRRLVSGEQQVQRTQSAPPHKDELPADLDQRVRLVGEW